MVADPQIYAIPMQEGQEMQGMTMMSVAYVKAAGDVPAFLQKSYLHARLFF